MEIQVEIQDNAELFRRELGEKLRTALEAVGLQAEGNSKLEIENMPRRVDTGLLRNSITHRVINENSVVIGSNIYYAVYVHEGTGRYAVNGSTGDGMTQGMKPNRFLINAVEKYRDEYKNIIETILRS